MKQIIIRPDDLIKWMGKNNYYKFICEFKAKHGIHIREALWIVAEVLEEEDKL